MLKEMFAKNNLLLSRKHQRRLGSTNIIEFASSGVKRRTGRIEMWCDGSIIKCWVEVRFLMQEKGFAESLAAKIFGCLEWHSERILTFRRKERNNENSHESFPTIARTFPGQNLQR